MSDRMRRTVELIARARQGDQKALDELFVLWGEPVLRKVRAKLQGQLRRKADSQVILQQAMLRTFLALPTFEMLGEHAFENLLETIVTNLITDEYRFWHQGVRDIAKEQELDAPAAGGSQPIGVADAAARTPSQIMREREVAEAVQACRARLKESHRELIRMRHDEGMDWKSIGAVLGIDADAARMRYATAKVALANCLRQRGIHPDGE